MSMTLVVMASDNAASEILSVLLMDLNLGEYPAWTTLIHAVLSSRKAVRTSLPKTRSKRILMGIPS